MNIEVGEFVRTKDGVIAKLDYVEEEFYYFDNDLYRKYSDKIDFLTDDELPEYITKHSPNIIDLIEVGDYVNGEEVISVGKKWLDTVNNTIRYDNIKSTVTHQQFEQMEYKVNG